MVKLVIRTLDRTSFDIEAGAEDSVLDVKKKIEAAHAHPANAQRLLFKGTRCAVPMGVD